MLVDAANYLQVYDVDLIYSWTPREFKNFVKGAQLRKVYEHELSAANALFIAKTKNKKKLNLKDLYDGDKVRKEIDKGTSRKEPLHMDRFHKAQQALKEMAKKSQKKGG